MVEKVSVKKLLFVGMIGHDGSCLAVLVLEKDLRVHLIGSGCFN